MKIGIIGAGAAGLSAAHYLKQENYNDVTIFEASDQVGGKCCSIEIDSHIFDTGAVIATMGYNRVLALAEEYNVPMINAPKLYYKSLETLEQRRLGAPSFEGFTTIKAMMELGQLLIKMRATRTPGHRHLEFDLAKNINDWLHENNLENIQEMLVPAFTGFGYGYKEHIPAAYLFKMAELTFANSVSNNWRWFKTAFQSQQKSEQNNLPFADLSEPLMFEKGYQSLFEAMAQGFNIKLNTTISTIEINGEFKALIDNHGQIHQFDQIIIATPPNITTKLVNFDIDLSKLFQTPRTLDYHVFLTEFKKPIDQEAWFLPENTLSMSGLGRPVVVSRVTPNCNIGTCYAYSNEHIDIAQLENNLEEDCDRLGLGLKSIKQHKRWDYFPHVDAEHFNEFYKKLEQVQGRNGIYFAGEATNFTTVEHVVCYSHSLVERFFTE